jgi:hypothetical protein
VSIVDVEMDGHGVSEAMADGLEVSVPVTVRVEDDRKELNFTMLKK